MASVTATRPASKPITSPDPWTERPAHDVPVADLVFGVRVRHRVIPGTWKIVRSAGRFDAYRPFVVRVREQAENGSLFGPVLSWDVAEVAAIVGAGPKAEPAPEPVQVEAPEPVQAAAAFTPAWFDASRVVARGDASWLPPTSRIGAIVHRDAIRHALAEMGAAPDADEAPEPASAPCCPDTEVAPCLACSTHEGPGDLSDGGWQDEFRWAVNGTIARSLAEQIDDHARGLRAMGSPLGDLLAERAEALAAEVRFLDASTVGQYRDRHEAMLDSVRAEAEAREAAGR